MKLTTVHQILIFGAISFGAVFTLRAVLLMSRGGGAMDAVMGLLSALVSVALAVYLRRFRRRLRVQQRLEAMRRRHEADRAEPSVVPRTPAVAGGTGDVAVAGGVMQEAK